MKILITGGNGFIGSHLSERLLARGDAVTLFDQEYTGNTREIPCDKLRGSVTDYAAVKQAVADKDVVFHFAAVSRVVWGQQEPLTCWHTNVMGTINVLEASRQAANHPIVFFASSREVYGEPQYLPVDEAHPKTPKSIYGMSKLCAEKACYAYGNAFDTKFVIFRFSNVYGSERDQLDRVIPKFMVQALKGEAITLYGGDQMLDFAFIDDTVAGILNAYKKSLEDNCDLFGEDFHFVTGRGVSVSELAELIIESTSSTSKIIREEPKTFDVLKFTGDPTKAGQWLGYKPVHSLEEGLTILRNRLLPAS